ncbi:MAG: hypothetical protein KUG78_20270 [Kangiellaceae bacterium]|nr:hypothetical protein [Kangiellaceae bacterium]
MIQLDCESNGGIWCVTPQKSGSHYLIIGRDHHYMQFGGLVSGVGNIVNANRSIVTGGFSNNASGVASSVSGGSNNVASGNRSNVSGGERNIASGTSSSVSDGLRNEASALWGTVGGGADRDAANEADWAGDTLLENF